MTDQRQLHYCFALWMQSHSRATWQEVAREWSVGRATAYRWLADYHEAIAWLNPVRKRV